MKLFMCFGGAAAVADDEAAAQAADLHRQRGRSLSFRERFLPGGMKKPSAATPPAKSMKRGVDAADDVYALFGASSSVASSAPLSSAESLDSVYSSSSSSTSARSSTASSSSSPSVSGVLFPPQEAAKRGSSSPAAGAAAVVLCLLLLVFCGRVGATLLTSTALYLFPRGRRVGSSECDAEDTAARRKEVADQGFLLRNRKK